MFISFVVVTFLGGVLQLPEDVVGTFTVFAGTNYATVVN